MHLLQLQTPAGLFSNDFIFHVVENAQAAAEKKSQIDDAHTNKQTALNKAASGGDMDAARELLKRKADINGRDPESGGTAIGTAALHGELEFVKFLLRRGAKVDAKNRDGNTALHIAAFMCERETVELLLEKGASPDTENNRGDSAIDVVSSELTDELAGFYRIVARSSGIELDLDRIKEERPKLAELLRKHSEESDE